MIIRNLGTEQKIESILAAESLVAVLDTSRLREEYLALVKVLHPDICHLASAQDALAKLNRLKDEYENGRLIIDDAGQFRVKPTEAIFTGIPDLLRQSKANFEKLKAIKGEGATAFHRYLPETMEDGGSLRAKLTERAIPISGLTLPLKHVLWVLSRMLEVCSWFSQEGYVHGGINPESVFIVPKTHGIIIGSFYHLSILDGRLKTISAKYKNWYPKEVFTSKRAQTVIDLECCKRTAAYLLGDRSGIGIKFAKTHNADFIDFLLKRHTDAYTCYRDYRKLLGKNFERKFHELFL